ncbi:glycosyltransferase family 4 protein [Paenibacillus xylaniclasticus]|uniref:glycosyltransferase family 4 protein n=1 Tax=Paenibacillus xylaniclasticus TaxID=588083 RepID=UPI001FE36E8F|nr:glycosyltransferase family 4 protein [Paenibacillus xylaniclasticus]
MQISYDYPPNSQWGTGNHVSYISDHLARKHFVTVVTRNYSGLAETDTGIQSGMPRILRCDANFDREKLIYPDNPTDSFHTIDGVLDFCDQMTEVVLSSCERPDIIHNHTWFTFPIARELSEIWKVPIVSTLHLISNQYSESGLRDTQKYGWHAMIALEEVWLRNSEKIIVPSQATKKYLTQLYPWAEEVVVVHEHPNPDTKVKKNYNSGETFQILSVGRIVPEKGLFSILEALKNLKNKRIVWTIAGDGNQREELLSAALAHGINVDWKGKLPTEEINALYCEADLLVVPSLTETYGLVVREAMQSGTPIIASDIPSFATLLTHRESGILVPLEDTNGQKRMDPHSLTEWISVLMNDYDLRKKIGEGALTQAKSSNNINNYMKALEDIYVSCIKK